MFSDDDRQTVRREALRVFVRHHPRAAHWYLFGGFYMRLLAWAVVVVGGSMLWASLPAPVRTFVDTHQHMMAVCTWIVAGTITAALVWFHIGGLAGRLRAQRRNVGRLTRHVVAAVALLVLAGWVMWS